MNADLLSTSQATPPQTPGQAAQPATESLLEAANAANSAAQLGGPSAPSTSAPGRVRTRRRSYKKWIVGGVALLAVAALITQCTGTEPTAAAEVASVTRGDVPITASANGTIIAAETVPLSFRGTGSVKTMNVVIGQQVKRGDVLATLDDRSSQREVELRVAAVKEAEARLAGARAGQSSAPADKQAGRAAETQSKVQVDASRSAERTAKDVKAQGDDLNKQTIQQAQAQLKTDEQQLVVEEQRLEEQLQRRTTALAKRDAETALLAAAKDKTAAAVSVRNSARDELTRQRQRIAELQAVRDEAQRLLQRLQADDERARSNATAALEPGMNLQWAKPATITNAENAVAAAERNAAAGEAATIPLQSAFDQAAEAAGKAETDQATAQGRLDTATSNLEAVQANVEAANRTREQASITVTRSRDALAVARRTASVNAARDRQAVDAARQSTAQADAALDATKAANKAKEQPGRPADVATAQAAVESAEIAVRQAQDKLAELQIVAPFDGVISALSIKVGEQAQAGTSVMSIMTDSGFLVRVGFPEIDAARIVPGDTAEVRFDALPDSLATGTVETVEPTATVVNGVSTYYARILIDSLPESVKVGMTANTKVLIDTRANVLTIPLNALGQNADGESIVRKVTERGTDVTPNKVEEVVVVIGATANGVVEVTSGLTGKEQVELTEVTK